MRKVLPHLEESVNCLATTPYALITGPLGIGIRDVMASAAINVGEPWVIVAPLALHEPWFRLFSDYGLSPSQKIRITSPQSILKQYNSGITLDKIEVWHAKNFIIEGLASTHAKVLQAEAALTRTAARVWIRPILYTSHTPMQLYCLGLRYERGQYVGAIK